jgi:hypothetical protein
MLALVMAASMLCSCEDWLDVKPKTQIDASDNFSTEQGYKDALTGIYLIMTKESLYGRQLSYGLVDVLGNQYNDYTSTHTYYNASIGNYTEAATRAMIDGVWTDMYNALANVNSLIEHIDQADRALFENENQAIIRGEAYALRAFLHFDLLRLFATAPSSGGTTALAIPYVKTFENKVTTSSTVGEVIANVLADLAVAAEALKIDPIIPGSTTTDALNYLRDRSYKFNYYAVKALQARVYLYNNDTVNALASAKEVIGSGAFTFVPSTEVAVSDNTQMNRVFTEELIFTLNISTLGTLSDTWLMPANQPRLTKSDDDYKAVYEVDAGVGSSDYRYVYLTTLISGIRYDTKLQQPTTIPLAYANRLPVIRLAEVYYIAAECLKETDLTQAIAYLNAIRHARGISVDIVAETSAEDFQNELFKEYEKEMICEGQLFYYYKRLNATSMRFSTGTVNDDVYVLPKPDDEVEFGS